MSDTPPKEAPAANPSNQVVALRGETELRQEDLRGHLSALLELPHVGCLLGAGSSKAAGGCLISDLQKQLKQLSNADGPWEDLVDSGSNPPDIEKLWAQLKLCTEARLPHKLFSTGSHDQAVECLDHLESLLYKGSLLKRGRGSGADPSVDRESAELQDHRSLLRKLVLSRQPGQPAPWIFTVNYDLAIEWAAEDEGISTINGFSGHHRRTFSPHLFDQGWYSTEARGEARFGTSYFYLAKLHGSLSWRLDGEEVLEAPWSAIGPKIQAFIASPEERPNTVLIPPGTAKYLDTVGFVQGELFRRFAEFVHQPNTVLFVNGYSLSDHHLNRLILQGLQNPTFQLVLCCFDHSIANGAIQPKNGELQQTLGRLAEQKHPSITFVVDGAADFERFVNLIPDTALLDQQAREMRRRVNELIRELGQSAQATAGVKSSE